jgi:RNA polymerase sigma-70 factor (ECF subfamily)
MARLASAYAQAKELPDTPEGFGCLYEETFDTVYRYARTLMNDPAEAEDVTADVYLQAWRKRDTFRGRSTAISWLLSITHNRAMSKLRKSGRETPAQEWLLDTEDHTVNPERDVIAGASGAEVRAAIRRLTPKQQGVILLRFFAGLSHKETATRLNLKSDAVRALQLRALRALRDDVEMQRAHSDRSGHGQPIRIGDDRVLAQV